jgi:uncharacterized cupin superfamily protein
MQCDYNMKPKVKKPTEEERQKAESCPIWEKEKSAFPWEYDVQETCLILEGEAVIRTQEGNVEFGKGDYVVFPKGLACTWEIKKKIRKHYNFG